MMPGTGDGTFQPRTQINQSSTINSPVAGDFNHDGIVDIALPTFSNLIILCLGNGNGTFRSQVLASGTSSYSVTLVDLNNDGKTDLAIVDENAGTVGVYLEAGGTLSDGTHQFTAWTEDLAGNRSPYSAPLAVTLDTKPPIASVSAADVNSPSAARYSFSTTFADTNGIDASTLANALSVSGPGLHRSTNPCEPDALRKWPINYRDISIRAAGRKLGRGRRRDLRDLRARECRTRRRRKQIDCRRDRLVHRQHAGAARRPGPGGNVGFGHQQHRQHHKFQQCIRCRLAAVFDRGNHFWRCRATVCRRNSHRLGNCNGNDNRNHHRWSNASHRRRSFHHHARQTVGGNTLSPLGAALGHHRHDCPAGSAGCYARFGQ